MGQDPYGGGNEFTPYQPGDPSAEHDEVPLVPYGTAAAPAAPPAAPVAPRKKQVWPWIVVGVVVLGIVGSCLAGIVSVFGTADETAADLPKVLDANDLTPGQCIVGTGLEPGDEPVGAMKEVSCANPHDAEVIAVNPLDAEEAANYDFDSENGAFDSCEPYFSDRALKLLDRTDLYLIALTESATPSVDDQVACLLVHKDGSPLDGPVSDLMPESVMPSPTL